jgi:hypothetical protein
MMRRTGSEPETAQELMEARPFDSAVCGYDTELRHTPISDIYDGLVGNSVKSHG